MDDAFIAQLAHELRALTSGAEIKRFRQRLDAATAKAVISHPSLGKLERASISLALNFSSPVERGWSAPTQQWDSGILELDVEACDTLTPAPGKATNEHSSGQG